LRAGHPEKLENRMTAHLIAAAYGFAIWIILGAVALQTWS
jgi:hypothetical protein